MRELSHHLIAALAVSLRIAPTFAFAPPFTLVRVPATVRVLLATALAAWLVAADPARALPRFADDSDLLRMAAGELLRGIALALALQIAFAALQFAGRTIDVQAGFGLATLIDPTTRTQAPLVGTLLAYLAGAAFFATDGPAHLLAIWQVSLVHAPPGRAAALDPAALAGFASGAFLVAMGLAGLMLLSLLVLDLAVAMMSRTLPQMNVLLLGFQVKALALIVLLPVTIALSGEVFLRLLRDALEAMPRLVAGGAP